MSSGFRLNLLDASWLMLDTADTPMDTGALLIFRTPKGAPPEYVSRLFKALLVVAPGGAPWTRTISRGLRVPFGGRWQDEPGLDLEAHVKYAVLPSPGGERELGVMVEQLHSAPLDMSRPAWECHVIDRLHGGSFALYVKLHHALMDVASFLRLLTDALPAASSSEVTAPWAITAVSSRAQAAGVLRGLGSGLASWSSVRALGRSFMRLARAHDGLRAPYTAPRAALNARIGPERRFATQHYPASRLQAVADACDATLDELILLLCASALRRFFKEHNALPDESLVTALPEQRGESGAGYGAIGFVSLGTQRADPRARLEEIQASLAAARDHLAQIPESLVPAYVLAAAAPYLIGQFSGFSGALPTMFNLVIASLPGPEDALYLRDARLEAIYPMFPLTQRGALTISTMRYAGTINVGLIGARETLPRLQRMAVYMGQALQDLEERIAAGAFHE
jgi:diacylglycerol O-acyltransferase